MPLLLRRFMERQFIEPRRADPFRSDSKPAGFTQCPTCKAVNQRGRWIPEALTLTRMKKKVLPPDRRKEECPACHQKREQIAGGVVELHGSRWKTLSEEIQKNIENTEKIARNRNDQQRLLWTRTTRGVMKIYLTLPELAHHIGHELSKSFHGTVEFERTSEEPFVRVIWNSDVATENAKAASKVSGKKNPSRAWRGRGKHVGARHGAGRKRG